MTDGGPGRAAAPASPGLAVPERDLRHGMGI